MWGRYFVRAALRVLVAISFFTLTTLICLFERRAIALHESSDSVRPEAVTERQSTENNVKICLFIILFPFKYAKLLRKNKMNN